MKKLTKRLLALVQALCVSAVGMASITGSAIYCVGEADAPWLSFYYNNENYVEIDKEFNSIFHNMCGATNHVSPGGLAKWGGYTAEDLANSTFFMSKSSGGLTELRPHQTNYVDVTISEEMTLDEFTSLLDNELGEDYKLNEDYRVPNSIEPNHGFFTIMTESMAIKKRVCNFLKENNLLTSCELPVSIVEKIQYTDSTGYYVVYEYNPRFDIYDAENVLAYLNEAGIEFEYVDSSSSDKPRFKFADTAVENYAVAEQIFNDTGIRPVIMWLENNSMNEVYIDALNNVEGDSNEDGMMNIADATAIVQYVANPDKYMLSAQGQYNADFDCDGITALDALTIQKALVQK